VRGIPTPTEQIGRCSLPQTFIEPSSVRGHAVAGVCQAMERHALPNYKRHAGAWVYVYRTKFGRCSLPQAPITLSGARGHASAIVYRVCCTC